MPAVRRVLGSSLSFKRSYLGKVLSSEKTITVRWGLVKPLSRVVFVESQGMIYGRALICGVHHVRFSQLQSPSLASRDGFANVREMVESLRRIYPFASNDDWFTVIEFRLLERLRNPVPKDVIVREVPRAAREALARGAWASSQEREALAGLAAGEGLLSVVEKCNVTVSRLLEILEPYLPAHARLRGPSTGQKPPSPPRSAASAGTLGTPP